MFFVLVADVVTIDDIDTVGVSIVVADVVVTDSVVLVVVVIM